MTLTVTLTKKILENIIHETFSNFGFLASSSLLDSLKLLGFYYATNAGISINIEDLRTPDLKKEYIETANNQIEKISQLWAEGIISDQERFQSIIDSWNIATESLKNRIVEYYQIFDPANNLYIMAFSGARGNMSQVRQLVGMRGLMSDQEGKIIDLPIQTNFREGLSSLDYIISSYGARKGIVDTALKTADSGYLTRRLIYLAQDLIIREFDCKTKNGILIFLKKKHSIKNLIGRELLLIKEGIFPYSIISNFTISESLKEAEKNYERRILTLSLLEKLKSMSPIFLKVRASLTCQSKGSICQKCYGWDLAHQKLIALGENVGIIAAQSIGEPGTQLTMRTFHTGGIFTGETLKQTLSPFSGKIIIPDSLKAFLYRTNHGIEVLKLKQETSLKIINWQGLETMVFLEIDSYLYILKTSFVYQGQLIAESLTQSYISTQRKLKPIYTQISGKIIFDGPVPIFCRNKNGNIKRIILKQGLFWIISGKIFSLPVEAKYCFSKFLKNTRAIGKLKVITPKEGIIIFDKASLALEILRDNEKIILNFSDLDYIYQNCIVKIVPIVKNYHYVDRYTVLAFIYIFPTNLFNRINSKFQIDERKIISIEKKVSKSINTFLISTDTEFWNFYGNLENFKTNSTLKNLTITKQAVIDKNSKTSNKNVHQTFKILNSSRSYLFLSSFLRDKKSKSVIKTLNYNLNSLSSILLRPRTFQNSLIKIKYSGLPYKQNREFNLFQNIQAICLPTNSLLNYIEFDYVLEKKNFATLVNYNQQTDDIVQGLPKIEELIEARHPKISSFLSPYPGIFLSHYITGKRTSKGMGYLYSHDLLKNALSEIYKNKPKTKLNKNKLGTIIFSTLDHDELSVSKSKFEALEEKRTNKQIVILFHNLTNYKNNILFYKNKLFKVYYFSNLIEPVLAKSRSKNYKKMSKKKYYFFKHKITKNILKIQGKKFWQRKLIDIELMENLYNFFKQKNNKISFNFINYFCTRLKRKKSEYIYKAAAKSKQIKEEIYLYKLNKSSLLCFEAIQTIIPYRLPLNLNLLFQPGEFIDIGEPLNDGIINSHELLNILFIYHSQREGIIAGTIKSLNKFQLILVNSIQSIYQGQGVTISTKHIEIIVKQMNSKVMIKSGGDTPFLPGELIPISLIITICEIFKTNYSYKAPIFEPKLLSATNSSLKKDGFLSAAGFQETRRVLTKAAIEGNSDWLRGLKESIISGRIMPAGSSFLNYKTYLDNFYYLKQLKVKE